ncbi:MAG: PKD domain-containing protein [Flavobacteriales bacterium]|nr:PKD domain-containing protein [Flavobacteriales bacterium]
MNAIPGQAPYSYSWDFDGDGVEDSSVPNPTWDYPSVGATTTYPICLTITTATGCTVTDCADIQVSPALDAGFGPVPQGLCAGAGVYLEADNPDGTSYEWYFGDNWYVTTPGPTVNYMYNDTGCFDVTLTISNLGCMADSTIANAICIWGPVADFTITQTCTSPFEVSFQNLSLFDDNLFWNFGDGSILEGDSADDAPDIHSPIHTYANEGTYSVCLTASADTSTCPHTRCFEIYIDEPSANLQFTPTSGCPPLCVSFSTDETYNVEWEIDFGNGDELTADAIVCDPGDDIDDCVQWIVSFTDDPGPVDLYNAPFIGGNIFPPCVNYDDAGVYTITAIATNINGCTDTTVYQDAITISTAPDFATFTATVTDMCEPFCVNVVADNVLGNYQWSYRLTAWGAWIPFGGGTQAEQLCQPTAPSFGDPARRRPDHLFR